MVKLMRHSYCLQKLIVQLFQLQLQPSPAPVNLIFKCCVNFWLLSFLDDLISFKWQKNIQCFFLNWKFQFRKVFMNFMIFFILLSKLTFISHCATETIENKLEINMLNKIMSNFSLFSHTHSHTPTNFLLHTLRYLVLTK